uniref:NADH-ubiquinone oxidoreductase chain 4 n=1 Tax=Pyramidella dolabrata TaxID=252582 RepID=B3DFG6_9GAST|nr:NADH dehydrogenase subunit 4 [Pyramidella dolabrata]ACE62853.1 NADH dehydrogenase subunit 4 [Pyramidella dolabrata]
MFALLFLVFSCAFISYCWVSSVLSLLIASLVSLFLLNQVFSGSYNLLFSTSTLSLLMVLLSVLLCFLSVISTPSVKSPMYITWIVLLGFILVLTFTMGNVLLFYIFFEIALIPTLLLIIGWGYQPERLQAGTYMMLYTVTASLPLLVMILWRCISSGTYSLFILNNVNFSFFYPVMVMVVFGAFLVKLPMYTVHLWLPKAHVEAPLAGSMILAGILLKLGGFGITRMALCFSLSACTSWSFFLVSLSIWGALLATLMCIRQTDMKALVAYSSVGHMGIVAAGYILDRCWGYLSATVTMVAHGMSSSALFCLTYFTYEKIHSRSLAYSSGMLVAFPALALLWFLFTIINMAAPGTLNLLGELFIVPCLYSVSSPLVVIMGFMVFLSAVYNMYLYTSICHGQFSSSVSSSSPLRNFEKVSLVAHLLVLMFIFKGCLFLFLVSLEL